MLQCTPTYAFGVALDAPHVLASYACGTEYSESEFLITAIWHASWTSTGGVRLSAEGDAGMRARRGWALREGDSSDQPDLRCAIE